MAVLCFQFRLSLLGPGFGKLSQNSGLIWVWFGFILELTLLDF